MRLYRLHFEGSDQEASQHLGMKAVRDEIRDQAKAAGVTIAKAAEYAYIVTEEEYQESLNI